MVLADFEQLVWRSVLRKFARRNNILYKILLSRSILAEFEKR